MLQCHFQLYAPLWLSDWLLTLRLQCPNGASVQRLRLRVASPDKLITADTHAPALRGLYQVEL